MKTSNPFSSICLFFLTFLLLSNFSIVYAQWQKILVDTLSPGVRAPTVGDINDDGDMDILVLRQTGEDVGEILWYESPNWTKHIIEYDLGFVKAADINNDSQSDIVAANMNAGEIVWYEAPSWTRSVIGTLSDAIGIDVVDLDKDGDLDVVATAVSPNKIVWYEAPGWIVHTVAEQPTCPADPVFVITGDIDDDNDIDILIASADGIFLFEAPDWTETKITVYAALPIDTGDIDGDGDLDIAIASGANVFWYENPTWTQHIINADLLGATGFALADLDKDGDIDVIASGNESDEVVWLESPAWIKHVIDDSLDGAYGLSAVDMDGDGKTDIIACGEAAGHVVIYKSMITDVPSDDLTAEIPKLYELYQNYPNPFNPTTTIKYSIPVVNENFSFTTKVELKVYNVLGREVATLVNEYKRAGRYEITFDASNLASGIYLYKIQTGNYYQTKKMILLR